MGCLRLTETETNVNPFLGVQNKMGVKSKKGVSYYPFGLTIDALSWERDDATENRFLYNSKELQDELNLGWYDYGARMYDAALGRWHVVDPLAENSIDMTPYHYVANSPINNIDPDGMDWYRDADGSTMWREGSDNIEGYENIGAEYAMDLGEGRSVTFTQNEATAFTTTVMNPDNDWASMFNEDGTPRQQADGTTVGCYDAACETVNNAGAKTAGRSTEVLMTNATANGRAGTTTAEAATGVGVMDAAIDAGNPLVVGVDYRNNSPNTDGMTDHFIAISGRTERLSNGSVVGTSYSFYDNRTRHRGFGTQSGNVLNLNNNRLSGTYQQGATILNYVVTTVRRNR